MTTTRAASALMAVLCPVLAVAAEPSPPRVEIVELPVPAMPPDTGRISWVGIGDVRWAGGGRPLATVGPDGSDGSAVVWGAVNEEALLLQVRVADDAHHTPAADDPQAGDSVVVTVDALGDTDLSTDAPAHGFDDLSVAFASVDGAAVADVTAGAAAGGRHGEMMPQVIRDDAPGVTTYRLRIPWRETRAYPAVGESMQLRVTVRDTDPGRDAPADQTTTLRLSFGMPMLRFAGTAVTRPTAAGPDGYAEVRLMVFSPTALVHATFGNADQTLDLTDPGTGPAFRRYAIRAYPGATSTGSTPLTLTVTEAGATLTRLEHEVHTAATTMPTTGRSER